MTSYAFRNFCTLKDIWYNIVIYTVSLVSLSFFVAAIYVCYGKKSVWSVCIPVVALIFGALDAFVLVSFPAFLVAAIYVSIPTSISGWTAMTFGFVFGVVVLLLETGMLKFLD